VHRSLTAADSRRRSMTAPNCIRRCGQYAHPVVAGSPNEDRVRAAEVIAALALATDLALGMEFEHGVRSTLFAMRLSDRLGVGADTAAQAYYVCLLFYIGCTTDAELAAQIFPDEVAVRTHLNPVLFGSPGETMVGMLRALAPPEEPPLHRVAHVARRMPLAARHRRQHLRAICEVAQMLADRLGLPASVHSLFAYITERWDGKGSSGVKGDEIPLPIRIAHVARDAAFHSEQGGVDAAAKIIRARAGGAFDPAIASLLSEHAGEILAIDDGVSLWDEVIDQEPAPALALEGEAIDRALAAIGDFADLSSPYLVGHSSGVAALAGRAGDRWGLDAGEITKIRRAALLHDLGRVAVPVRVWQKAGPLTPHEWEQVRLHAYCTERVLARSPFLAAHASVAVAHHERLDGSGYHRGTTAAGLTPAARLLAAADAYHAMTERRPHREALTAEHSADALAKEALEGHLDADAVAAVLAGAGQPAPRFPRPAGLTEREAQVIALVARGLQTKQVARTLGISVKTADRHIQNSYGKIGVSTRAAATLFAMEHGLIAWGELPISPLAPSR
jgi:HD-GYP domain-containing protein (c-di-GMP phosphodiesterase class II)